MQRTVLAVAVGLRLALFAGALAVGPAAAQESLVIAQGAGITTVDPTRPPRSTT